MSQQFPVDPAMFSLIDAKPRVALLDDEPEDLEMMKIELSKFGLEKIDTATRGKELNELLSNVEYDVVSTDSMLHGVEKSGDILQVLGRKYPEVARVVFTQNKLIFEDAMNLGADACIFKQVGRDLTEYTTVMKKAARLGFARRIVRRLEKLGQSDLPSLPVGSLDIDDQTEKVIYEKARQIALQYRTDDKDDGGLRELLIRRGWWKVMEFDAGTFVHLKKHERIKHLAEYAGATAAEISTILEITKSQVEEYLSRGSFNEVVSQNVTDAVDRLLSVWGFVLRLSGYDPELMPYFWKVREYFKESFEKPPWDEPGLADYLKAQGQQGLTKALNWIRSH